MAERIEIYANIGNMDDLNSVVYCGASGIGLLRSEFQESGEKRIIPARMNFFWHTRKIAETMGGSADRRDPYC